MLIFLNLKDASKQFSAFRLVSAFLTAILHQNQPHEPGVYRQCFDWFIHNRCFNHQPFPAPANDGLFIFKHLALSSPSGFSQHVGAFHCRYGGQHPAKPCRKLPVQLFLLQSSFIRTCLYRAEWNCHSFHPAIRLRTASSKKIHLCRKCNNRGSYTARWFFKSHWLSACNLFDCIITGAFDL